MKEKADDKWNVTELEEFFNSVELPAGPIQLDECTLITDVQKFIHVELQIVKEQNGKDRYLPYLERLKQLHVILS